GHLACRVCIFLVIWARLNGRSGDNLQPSCASSSVTPPSTIAPDFRTRVPRCGHGCRSLGWPEIRTAALLQAFARLWGMLGRLLQMETAGTVPFALCCA